MSSTWALRRFIPMGIQPRIMITLMVLGVLQIGITGMAGMFYIKEQLEHQLAKKNLEQARTLALIPSVRQAVKKGDSPTLQKLVTEMHKVLGVSFVAIGDKNGIRLAHRLENRIGLPMIGGDNDLALKHGQSYISSAVGSMGPSTRGKAPVFDDDGHIIGVISVGYLINELESKASAQATPLAMAIMIALGLSMIAATLISQKLKRTIHGLEPREIAWRYTEQIQKLNQQIIQVKNYADLLRVQTHEYSNKLSTISGLIQLGAVDQAVELIHKESSGYQSVIAFLQSAIPNPVIAGVILGKYHRANELGLTLDIDPDSHFADIPDELDTSHIVTILGNLIDNAFDATSNNRESGISPTPFHENKHKTRNSSISTISSKQSNKTIFLSMTDIGNDLIIEVEDNGAGIPETLKNTVYELGATSKVGEGHGYGLFLVKEAVKQLQGYLTFDDVKPAGTRFTVYIPKSHEQTKDINC
ncbi:MAG: ATP-binding protein [Endozoicomonas sp.]|uniref:ATP-binding protein n=1 Tax=Endozoicomonas sp. TaxID=1892382 RepID=UPI003D9B6969